jgi:ABC-type Fe3+ transport system substrate-binding protein
LYCSSKKDDSDVKPEQFYKAPSHIKKTVYIFTDFDSYIILPLLQFINEQTGLSCSLTTQKKKTSTADNFDLYIGTCMTFDQKDIAEYSSKAWSRLDTTLHKNGVFIWSAWYSCVAYNSLLKETMDLYTSNDLSELIGEITTIFPVNDNFLLIIFYTLYQTYGEEIIEDLNNAIPLYRKNAEELIFTVESGQYPVVLGIDGYFRSSISKGYPLRLLYSSFAEDKYPVTTVSGNNIAFISSKADNRDGAEYIIDFLGSTLFQSYLAENNFTPVMSITVEDMETEIEEIKPDKVIPAMCDRHGFEEFKKTWTQIAYPEGIEGLFDDLQSQ